LDGFAGHEVRMKTAQRRLQEGQAIALIALLILVLFGMLGLAIDSGRAYVDRRDQQAAVDSAALSAGDWYENYQNLYGSTLPQAKQIYQNNLHLYTGPTSDSVTTASKPARSCSESTPSASRAPPECQMPRIGIRSGWAAASIAASVAFTGADWSSIQSRSFAPIS